jgi:hypothetical protein
MFSPDYECRLHKGEIQPLEGAQGDKEKLNLTGKYIHKILETERSFDYST